MLEKRKWSVNGMMGNEKGQGLWLQGFSLCPPSGIFALYTYKIIYMKQILIAAALLFASFSLLQAQGEDDKGKFSYSYGVLVGKGLKQQGLSPSDLDVQQLVAGIQDMLGEEPPLINEIDAQQIVQRQIQIMQQAQAEEVKAVEAAYFAENIKKPGMQQTESGVQYEILKEGEGEIPNKSSKIKAHYHGLLLDGTVFDSSVDRGEPISLSVGGVIQGWQDVLVLMPVGSKWRVYIPSALGYGARAAGKIPANSTLIFEIELLAIEG